MSHTSQTWRHMPSMLSLFCGKILDFMLFLLSVLYWTDWGMQRERQRERETERQRERDREREREWCVVASTWQNADSRPSELEIKEGQPPHLPSQPHLWHMPLPSLWLMACRISEDAFRRQSKMDPLFRRNRLLDTLNLMGLWANKVVPPQSSQSWMALAPINSRLLYYLIREIKSAPYSTHASCSAPAQQGVCLQIILSTPGWSLSLSIITEAWLQSQTGQSALDSFVINQLIEALTLSWVIWLLIVIVTTSLFLKSPVTRSIGER